MKKFLLTLMMALIAVMVTAQPRTKKQLGVVENLREAPTEKKWTPRTALKNIPAPSRTKVLGKKAPRKAAISSINDLEGDFVIVNEEYDVDDDYKFVPAPVAQKGNAVSIEVRSENEIAIYGFTPDVTETDEPITATVDIANGTITIPVGQTLYTTKQYGPVTLENASAEGDLTGVIYEGGIIVLNNVWIEMVEYQGSQYLWGDYFHSSTLAPANGIMQYKSTDGKGTYTDQELNVLIVQDQETKDVTVYGFSIWGLAVDIELTSDKAFVISSDNAVDGSEQSSSNGLFYVVGSDAEGNLSLNVPGKGTSTELTSDSYWTLYSWAGYWRWAQAPFTITLTDGTEFEYPEPLSLVTLPDGLTPVAMTSYYTTGNSSNREKHEGTVNVAKDGTDVYIQGLDLQIPAAWVKGTLDENTGIVTIPVTYMGEASGTPHYFGGYGENEEPVPFVLEYSSSTDSYYGPSWVEFYQTEKSTEVYYYSGLFIGTKPTALTMPADVTPIELPYAGKSLDSQSGNLVDISGKVKIGKKENLVYIQGFYDDFFENNCLVGQVMENEGSKFLVIPSGQYVGEFTSGFLGFALSYSYDSATGQISYSNIIFTYDDTNNYLVLATPLVLSRSSFDINYYEDMVGQLEIGSEPAGIEAVKAVKEAGDGAWYTIGGQRVAQPTEKGLYIHNGKKVVIK